MKSMLGRREFRAVEQGESGDDQKWGRDGKVEDGRRTPFSVDEGGDGHVPGSGPAPRSSSTG
jgi:hypothetical protein